MNTAKEVLINAEYDDLKEIKDGVYIAKKADKYGIINTQNETPRSLHALKVHHHNKI